MKAGDFAWGAAMGCVLGALLYPPSHGLILEATKIHPYVMGFIKFSVLATMGELLAIRIVGGEWSLPSGLICRAMVWGFIGFCLVAVFAVMSSGVTAAIRQGILPSTQSAFSRVIAALWTSIVLNMTSAPALMIGHRIADTYLDAARGNVARLHSIRLRHVVEKIDWQGLIGVVCCRTIPFFWVPAHTVTFLLPAEYRVLYAAFLSVALGVILAFTKRSQSQDAAFCALVPQPVEG